MTPRENFLYYVLGMVSLQLMTQTNYIKISPDEHRTTTFHKMNKFLSDCGQSPMFPFEIRYIDKIQTYDKQLNNGRIQNKKTQRE